MEPENKTKRVTVATYPTIYDIAKKHHGDLSGYIHELLVEDLRAKGLLTTDQLRDIMIGRPAA